MRKYAFVILFLLLSCNPNQPIPQNTIVVGVDRYPENHDPRLPTDSVSQKINQLIHNGLLTINDKLELVPQLATYELLDTKTYQFTLKPGIYFHHGKKLTSADVKATYESMLDSELHSPFKSSLSIIEKIDTPDEKTIIFRLKKPNEVYYEIYKIAKGKAKQHKKAAITHYLEAKKIKNTYLMDDLDYSDDSLEDDDEDDEEDEDDIKESAKIKNQINEIVEDLI